MTIYDGVAFRIDDETARMSGPQPWHAKMTCRNCNKKGHIASLRENAEVANTNVQDGEFHEDATQLFCSTPSRRILLQTMKPIS